jgi:hypothetical protein
MPDADPEKSFDVAVRHLFRHLDDAAALRRNPLARFVLLPSDDGKRQRDEVALATLRSKLLDASRACYAEDLEAGLKLQAQLHFTIATDVCSRRSPSETASSLGISLRQFYRYRRTICLRVARVLLIRESRAIARAYTYDPLYLLRSRAASLVDHGLAASAVAELERALVHVSSRAARARTLLELSNAFLELGDLSRAVGSLQSARQLMGKALQPQDEFQVARVLARLMDCRIAYQTARDSDAAAMMQILVEDWDSRAPSAELTELGIEIQVENCLFLRIKRPIYRCASRNRSCDGFGTPRSTSSS